MRLPRPPTSTAGRFDCWNASSSPGDLSRDTPGPEPRWVHPILSSHTKLVWIETPTNPLLQIIDIAALAAIAHDRGALLAVDNTFASPYLQRPIELGADLVVHSTTKYLAGHSDVIGGAVAGRRKLLEPIAFYQNAAGAVLDHSIRGWSCGASKPWRCAWSAIARARPGYLAGGAKTSCERVLSGPVKSSQRRRRTASDGRLRWDDHRATERRRRRRQQLLRRARLFSLAESLEGVESLIGHPATMTHASIPAAFERPAALTTGWSV